MQKKVFDTLARVFNDSGFDALSGLVGLLDYSPKV